MTTWSFILRWMSGEKGVPVSKQWGSCCLIIVFKGVIRAKPGRQDVTEIEPVGSGGWFVPQLTRCLTAWTRRRAASTVRTHQLTNVTICPRSRRLLSGEKATFSYSLPSLQCTKTLRWISKLSVHVEDGLMFCLVANSNSSLSVFSLLFSSLQNYCTTTEAHLDSAEHFLLR